MGPEDRHPATDRDEPALPDGAQPRHGHRTSLDDPLPPSDDPLVRQQEEAAALEAARLGGPPPPTKTPPAHRPLEEAGEGEAEGFEEAERLLAEERAAHGEERSTPEVDEFVVEEESRRSTAAYGEPDEIDPTKRS